MTKKVLCPACGIWHAIEEEPKAGLFENRVRRPTFKTGIMAPTMQQPGIATEQPTGLPNWDSHVKIPLRQAVIFGLLDAPLWAGVGMVGGAGVAMLFNIGSKDSLTLWGYVLFIGGGGVVGGLIALCQEAKKRWPERLAEYDALLWIEEVTGLDLNGDGEVGEPEPETSVLRIELQDRQGRPRLIADLDTDQERFTELARLVVVFKMGFCEATAKKAGYSRKEWEGIRDQLVELGAAVWKDADHHQQGITLRENGWDLLKKMLTPSLPAGGGPKNPPGTNKREQTNDLTGKYEHIKEAR